MSFANAVREHLRAVLLGILEDLPGYAANDAILADLARSKGVVNSIDVVRTEVRWLEEQGLVTVEDFAGELLVATLTRRGLEVATGIARVPGVARALPGGHD